MKPRRRGLPQMTGNRTSQEAVVSAMSITRTTIVTGAETLAHRNVRPVPEDDGEK
jgi:biotin operon repressor